jgi:hypothetical protein
MSHTAHRIPLWRRLLHRTALREPTAFVTGDTQGAVFENVESGADDFVRGNSAGSVFRNVRHERKAR